MPELPEVETVARELAAALTSAAIESVECARTDYVRGTDRAREIVGRTVARVDRHGKRILLRLRPDGDIVIHLGMSGRAVLSSRHAPREPHTHFVVTFAGRPVELRLCDPRRFGGVWLALADDPRPARLGPDALAMPLSVFREVVARGRMLKALLLDQSLIAGLGNIYVDEALHRARLHPTRVADSLGRDEVRTLHRAIQRVLGAALRFGGSTLRDYRRADGMAGAFQRLHRVYGRAGEPCLRCGGTIERRLVAGRGTHTCPRCQRPPRRTRIRRSSIAGARGR